MGGAVTQRSKIEKAGAAAGESSIQAKKQPDPMLQITAGRVSGTGAALLVFAVIMILWIVLYGLNQPVGSPTAPSASGLAVAGNSSSASPTSPQNSPHKSGSGIAGNAASRLAKSQLKG
ncbi:MAG TPA: hypothetical protein VMU69_17650 [Bradyrhizobium sp.]|nr:hypothetical protein [Bradyrhizobium sp.]